MLLPFLAISLAGCGGDSSSSSSEESTSKTSIPPAVEVDYGSAEAPLTVAKFNEEAAKLGLGEGDFSDEHFFVRGFIQSAPSLKSSKAYNIFKLVDNKTDTSYINVGGATLSDGITDIYQNDTVVIEGLGEYYNGYYSLFNRSKSGDIPADNPTILSVSRGTSTVKSDVDATKVTISGLQESYTNGETATFTVTCAEGLRVNNVSADLNGTLTESEGTYSFVVKGDTTISVSTIDSSIVTKDVTFDFEVISQNNKLDKETGTDGQIHSFISDPSDGVTIDTRYAYLYSKTLMLFNTTAGDNIVASSTTLGKIYSIVVTIGNGAAKSAEYQLSVSSEPITKPTEDEFKNATAGSKLSYNAADGDDYKYFSICSNAVANGRLGKIEVTYIVE